MTVRFGAVLLATFAVGCGGSSVPTASSSSTDSGPSDIAHDFATPEGAILSLEDAYRNRDVEAAVKCKDFETEAQIMLSKLQGNLGDDPEVKKQTTEVLELSFRQELKQTGFPDFRNLVSSFSAPEPYGGRDDIVRIKEICAHSNGTTTTNVLHCAKRGNVWKVVTILEE